MCAEQLAAENRHGARRTAHGARRTAPGRWTKAHFADVLIRRWRCAGTARLIPFYAPRDSEMESNHRRIVYTNLPLNRHSARSAGPPLRPKGPHRRSRAAPCPPPLPCARTPVCEHPSNRSLEPSMRLYLTKECVYLSSSDGCESSAPWRLRASAQARFGGSWASASSNGRIVRATRLELSGSPQSIRLWISALADSISSTVI